MTNVTFQTVSKYTKKALENNESFISIKGFTFSFEVVRNKYGKAYFYREIKGNINLNNNLTPKKRRNSKSQIIINELPKINLNKITLEDKKSVITFYKNSNSSLKAICEAYNIMFNYEYSVMSLQRKFRRWLHKFKTKGIEGLKDSRGGNRFNKVDHELFLKAIVKNARLYTYYSRYCAYYCFKHNLEYDIYNLKSNISYSGFRNYFLKHKKDLEVDVLLKGKDYLDDMVPTFNSSKYADYPNEQWQIDSTKIDIMAKVPMVNGNIDYFSTKKTNEYKLERFTLVGIVDVFSGARVYELFYRGNSYSNVKLLRKAIKSLGVPELIKGDNGKDYVSSHFQSVLGHLGILYHATTPYKGSEKGKIERAFRTLQHNYLFENLAGFTGHNTREKKLIENQGTKKSQRKKALPTTLKEKIMWWWDLSSCIDGIIKHLFNKEFEAHKVDLKIPKNLDFMLGKRYEKIINTNGVAHNKTYYRSVKLWEKVKIRDKVLVIEDIKDMNIMYAFIEGEYIKLLSDKRFNICLEEAKEIKKSYKKRVNQGIKQIVKNSNSDFSKLQQIEELTLKKENEFSKANLHKDDTPSKKEISKLALESSQELDIEFIRSVS